MGTDIFWNGCLQNSDATASIEPNYSEWQPVSLFLLTPLDHFHFLSALSLSLNQLQLHWHTSLCRFQWFISHWRWWCWWTSTRWGTKAPRRSARGSRSRMQGRSWWYGLVGGKGSKLLWTETLRGYRIYQTGESLLFATNWGSFQTLTPLDCLFKLYHTKLHLNHQPYLLPKGFW